MKSLIVVYGTDDEDILPELKGLHSTVRYYPRVDDITSVIFEDEPTSIICLDNAENPNFSLEMAQIFRMKYPIAKIFLLTKKLFSFDKKTYQKNGFDDAFLLPWEKASLLSAVETADLYVRCPDLMNFTPIFVSDFTPDEILEFNVYIFLSLNGILITLLRAGEALTREKIHKAHEAHQNVLYLHKDDLPLFQFHYKGKHPNQRSNTEKFSELDHACRDILSDVFTESVKDNTFGRSSELLGELKKILQEYVQKSNAANALETISYFINRSGNPYNHAINVAVYSGVFAGLLSHPHPIDVALAGLFHDLGLSQLDEKFHEVDPTLVEEPDRAIFETHLDRSIDLLRNKKVILPESSFTAISQHHEKISGTGYPHQLIGARISPEARILAIADAFDYLTRQTPGQKTSFANEALECLLEKNTRDPSNIELDPQFLKALLSSLKGGGQ